MGLWGLAILQFKQLTLYQLVTTDEFRRADREYRNQLLTLSLFGAALRQPLPGVRKGFPRLVPLLIPPLVRNAFNVAPNSARRNGFAPVSSASQPIGRWGILAAKPL